MKNESIKTYSYRISQASPTELIVILYDMAIEYLEDAKEVVDIDDDAYKQNLKHAKRVVDRLSVTLDMQYDISKELLKLYIMMSRFIIKATSTKEIKLVDTVINMLTKLRKSFYEISKQDTSGPIMKNTQQVYAGLTYSNAGNSNEYSNDPVNNRGYKV
ncbi:MAG: flagellar protein FliS [Lachnospira sp.]|nr:flagellar protein FliS [Lachnospira sp.]